MSGLIWKCLFFFPDVFPDLLLCRFLFRKIRAGWLIRLKNFLFLPLSHFACVLLSSHLYLGECSFDSKLCRSKATILVVLWLLSWFKADLLKKTGCIIDLLCPSVRSLKDLSKVIHLYTYFWAGSNFWFTFIKNTWHFTFWNAISRTKTFCKKPCQSKRASEHWETKKNLLFAILSVDQ